MKVIYGVGNIKSAFKHAVIIIGVFDGLHKGHQKLITSAVRRAKKIGGTPVLMTFAPHPVHVLYPNVHLPLIVSLPHRLHLIEQLGVACCIVVKFTRRFSQLSPQSFIKRYLVDRLQAAEVFVGDDFRFGQNRKGTVAEFEEAGKKYGFKINAVSAVKGNGGKVSSTDIREAIAKGSLAKAKKYLGRPIAVMGKVQRGEARGKKLGFATANIYPENEMLPPVGVYAVQVELAGKIYKGMANVGYRPSFRKKNKKINVEVHIFHFKKNIYGKTIIVEFIQKIRSEKIFHSPQELTAQLKQDQDKAKKILG